LETPIAFHWRAETIEEEEKNMRSVVEALNFTGLELVVTDDQGKH
jgi:hypothetical protein